MRWFISLLLAAALAGAVLFAVPGVRRGVQSTTGWNVYGPTEPPPSDSLKALGEITATEKISRLEVNVPGSDATVLTKAADGTWTQPGNWPVRQADAESLAKAVAGITTRFRPVPIADDKLSEYGLAADQKPVKVKVESGGRTVNLTVGQPASDAPPTARPTYLRVDTQSEVLRVPTDTYTKLAARPDAFRGKRLFPDAERVKVTGGDAVGTISVSRAAPLFGDAFAGVTYSGPDGGVKLTRSGTTPVAKPTEGGVEPTVAAEQLAAAWDVAAVREPGEKTEFKPLKDKADPAKLKAVLAGVADLWAESFLKDKTPAETGLDKPDFTVEVAKAKGGSVVLEIGKVSRTTTKVEPPKTPPSPFAPPPQPTFTTEEFRYAKLRDNPLVFEIKSDKLKDILPKPEDLRDGTVVRFNTEDVTELAYAVKGGPTVKLTKKRGNPDAAKEEEKQDRWYVGDKLAETSKVTELLDQLSKLEAKGKENVLDAGEYKKFAAEEPDAEKVTVVVAPKPKDGEPTVAPQTLTLLIGKHDAEKKKLYVRVVGRDRLNAVADDVLKNVTRPVLAYRGRKLFDTADAKLEAVAVTQPGGESFTLTKTGEAWKLTAPVQADADEGKVSQLTGDLSRLEATEFLDDAPKDEDLDKKYGLKTPKLTATLTVGGKPQKLEVGGGPEFKPEYYARLNGGGVFTMSKTSIDTLKAGAAGLLPLQLWTTVPEKITAVEIARPDGAYTISPEGTEYKIAGPFAAKVPAAAATPLLAAVGSVRADKYETATATEPAKYGFDKPAVVAKVTFKESKLGADGKPADTTVTRTLTVGNVTAAGATSRFAKSDAGPPGAVFVVPEQLFKDADKPALELLDKKQLGLDPAKITKLALGGPNPITITKDDKGTWKAEGHTFAVDKLTADMLAGAVGFFPVQKLAGYGAAVKWAEFGLEPPVGTVTATAEGKPHTIKLGKAAPGGGTYARADDGPAVAILDPAVVADLSRGKFDFIDRTLTQFDPATLTAVVRKKGAEDFELASTPAGWDVAKPAKFKADAPLMDDLADQLSRLRAVKVVDFGKPDLKKYGLDTPAAVLTLKGAKDVVLKLGKPADEKQPDGDRFALVDGAAEQTVGVLPAGLVKKLLADPIKFRDRGLAKFVDADAATLVRGDRAVTFAKLDGTWKLVKPVAGDAETADLDELVNALAKLRADELVAEKPKELKPYGLDKPEAKWTFSAGGKEVLSLLVGTKEKDGRAFAKLEKGDMVAALDAGLTAKVLGEYRKRAVWAGLDAAQAETVAVDGGAGKSFVLQKLGASWADRASPTAAVDTAKVTELLDALAGLKAERFVADTQADPKLFGLQPPQRVIVVSVKGGGTKILQLGRFEGGSGDKRVYARVEEPGRTDVFVLSEADTAKVMRDRPAFAGK